MNDAKLSGALPALTPALNFDPELLLRAQPVKVVFFDVDGVMTDGGLLFTDADTALNYSAVDGFKYAAANDRIYMELQHDKAKECQTWWEAAYGWKSPVFGGQGDLTQVFKTEDGWVITTIHTFLGEITKLNKNNN